MSSYWQIGYCVDKESGRADFTKLEIFMLTPDTPLPEVYRMQLDSHVLASRNRYETREVAIKNARRLAKENNLVYIPDYYQYFDRQDWLLD